MPVSLWDRHVIYTCSKCMKQNATVDHIGMTDDDLPEEAMRAVPLSGWLTVNVLISNSDATITVPRHFCYDCADDVRASLAIAS